MKIHISELQFSTNGDTDVIDITDKVSSLLKDSGLRSGIAVISVIGSTAGLTTCEFEPALVKDIKDFFERLIPKRASYHHDSTWGDANGFSHLRASLLGPSLTLPFQEGLLILGTWQQIVLIDFDNRPRRRKLALCFQGE